MSYELFKREYKRLRPDAPEEEIRRGYVSEGITVGEALGKGLEAGWYNTLGGFGTVGEMIGLPTSGWAEKQYQKAGEYAMPEELQGYLWDKPELLANPAWWAYQTGQTLPTVASSFLPGAAAAKGASFIPALAKAAPAIGAAVSGLSGGALEAAGTYRDTGNLGQAAAFGAASSVLNAIPMFKVLQGGSLPSRLLKGAAWEGLTEYAEEPTEAVITGRDPIEAMKQGLNVIPGAFASALLMGAPAIAMQGRSKANVNTKSIIPENPIALPTLPEALRAEEKGNFIGNDQLREQAANGDQQAAEELGRRMRRYDARANLETGAAGGQRISLAEEQANYKPAPYLFPESSPAEAVQSLKEKGESDRYEAAKPLKDKSAAEIFTNWRALSQMAQEQAKAGNLDKAAEILNNRRSYGIVMEEMTRKRVGEEKADYAKQAAKDMQFDEDVMAAIGEMMNRPETHSIETPERQQLRSDITDQLYGQGAPTKAKRVDIIIGPPAAGKSTIAEQVAKEHGSMIIDSDMAKERLPEYDGGMGANAVHQESKSIAGNVLMRAMDNGDNIVLPIVGKNVDNVRKEISAMRQSGYNVALHYIDLPIEKATQRAIDRFRKTGRFVSPGYIQNVGAGPKNTYEVMKNENAAQEFRAYSTDVQQGQPAKILEEVYSENGKGRSRRRTFTGEAAKQEQIRVEQQRAEYTDTHKQEIDALASEPVKPITVDGQPAVSVLGNGVARDFREKSVSKLLGKQVRNPHDLAVLAQVYRDPRYETLRYFITDKAGRVVYQTGVTARLPDATPSVVGDPDAYFAELTDRIAGVDGGTLWMLHNHPSGNPMASRGDVNATRHVGELVEGKGLKFGGHVVINHQQYSVITSDTIYKETIGANEMPFETNDLGVPQQYDVNVPLQPHPILGMPIRGPEDVMHLGKMVETSNGYITLIGRAAGQGKVRLVAEIAPGQLKALDTFKGTIQDLALKSGSAEMFLVGVPENLSLQADTAIHTGLLLDAIVDGPSGLHSRAQFGISRSPTAESFGKPFVGERVEQQKAPYGPREAETDKEFTNKPAFVRASELGVSPQMLAQHAKRNVQDWQATEHLAKTLGTSTEEVDKFMRRNIGTAFNAEQLHQAADILTKTWGKTKQELGTMVQKLDQGNLTDNDLVHVQELFHEINALQAQYMGVRGEAGRALQIFRKLKDATKVAEAAQMVAEVHGGREMLEEKLKALATLEDTGAGMKAIREEMQATKWDQFMEWYINSLVSGVPTHVVNMTSNLLVSMLEDVTRFVASGVGIFHGGEKVSLEEAAAHAAATLPGAVDGFKAFAEAIKDENSPLVFRGKMDQPYRRAIPGTLGKIVRTPTRFLGAEDALFKTMAMSKELHALAVRESRRTGVPVAQILENPSKELTDAAWAEGLKRTFTSRPGPVAQALLQLRRRHPLINFIFPFVTTPANIVNYALRYTPAALGYSEVRQDIAKGGVARDLALARIATGSSIAAGIIGLAASGLITGAPPEDPNKRRLWYASGNQPYSLKIGDTWYSYSRLEPVGMLFGISADMYRLANTIGTDEADKLGSLIIGSVSNNLLSKTYLRGLSDMVNAISDPEQYGENWVKRMVTGLTTPVFLSYTAKTIDPNLREADTILEAIKARVPGLSQQLEPRLDIFGRERTSEGPAAYRFVSPAYIKKDIKDQVARELLRLDVSVPAVGKKLLGVELNTAQRNELRRLLGSNVYAGVQRVINAPGYKKLPDFAKAYVLDKVVSGIRRYGRLYWEMQHPQIMQQAKQLKLEEMYSRGG